MYTPWMNGEKRLFLIWENKVHRVMGDNHGDWCYFKINFWGLLTNYYKSSKEKDKEIKK